MLAVTRDKMRSFWLNARSLDGVADNDHRLSRFQRFRTLSYASRT
jgi:hypothetical protein